MLGDLNHNLPKGDEKTTRLFSFFSFFCQCCKYFCCRFSGCELKNTKGGKIKKTKQNKTKQNKTKQT